MKPPVTKSASAFRTIGEAAEAIGVPHHVLRFWETRFPQLQPMKRGGGRRYYRPADMDLLRTIHAMLHDDGLTIRGAQKALSEQGAGRRSLPQPAAATQPDAVSARSATAVDLLALRAIRDRLALALAA